ncbi:hypothetical protein NQZ68_008579 [Dissostichus eleginoides]|nr:hypothetical protein NQZ68_008579 [Dissostichus eleginoides]
MSGFSACRLAKQLALPEDLCGLAPAGFRRGKLAEQLALPENCGSAPMASSLATENHKPTASSDCSTVNNGTKFENKEMVLKKVRANKGLQEKGIRFQTPFTRIRIHWNNGVKSYNNARDAAEDMRAGGLAVDVPSEDMGLADERIGGAPGWLRAGRLGSIQGAAAQRAKEKLQGYQRKRRCLTR